MWVFDEAFCEELAGKWDTSGVSSWRPVPGLLSWCSDFGSGHCGSSGDLLSEVSSSGARSSVGSCGLRASVSVPAPWRQARGRWFRDWLPDGMPHFHSIPFDSDWTVVYMKHNVDSCIHVVSLCIDNKHILNLNLNLNHYHMPVDAPDDLRSQGTSRHSIDQVNWNIFCLYFLSDRHDITQLKFCNLSSVCVCLYCYRHEYTFGHVWGCGFANANALEMTKFLRWALDVFHFYWGILLRCENYFWEVIMIVIQSQGMIQDHIVAEKLKLYRNHHSYADYFLYFLYLFGIVL